MKGNSKPWFGNQIISSMQRQDKFFKNFKHFGVETNKYNLKVAKMHSQKLILKKKISYFEEEPAMNRNKPKELWKALKSLSLSLDKTSKSKIYLKEGVTIQFEALESTNIFRSKGSALN